MSIDNPKHTVVPLIKPGDLANQIVKTAHLINQHYAPMLGGPVIIMPVMTGALAFAGDLMKLVQVRAEWEPITAKSYHGTERGPLLLPETTANTITTKADGRHVLIVEDILDSGATLAALITACRKAGALSVEVVVMLRKKGMQRFLVEEPRWVLFDIPDVFVLGYGLDIDGLHRNIPFVGMVAIEKPKIITPTN